MQSGIKNVYPLSEPQLSRDDVVHVDDHDSPLRSGRVIAINQTHALWEFIVSHTSEATNDGVHIGPAIVDFSGKQYATLLRLCGLLE